MIKEGLEALLAKSESPLLDWKEDFPLGLLGGKKHVRWDRDRARLLKSLISLANTFGPGPAYLVYGIKDDGATRTIRGISKSFDDADFQQWAQNTFDPQPKFKYSELQLDATHRVGIFIIEHSSDYPHVVKVNMSDILHEGQVWFRHGTKNSIALRADLHKMFFGDEPFKFSRTDDPHLNEISESYRERGREPCLPLLADLDAKLAANYELAYYPGTRRVVWAGAVDDRYENILMLKPKTL